MSAPNGATRGPPPDDGTASAQWELCALCGQDRKACNGSLGALLGPLDDGNRTGVGVYVHRYCALWSSEVYHGVDGATLRNVGKAIRRGRQIRCGACGERGATLGCRVERCNVSYHLHCARAVGCTFNVARFLIACPRHAAEFRNEEGRAPAEADAAGRGLPRRFAADARGGRPSSEPPGGGGPAAAGAGAQQQGSGAARMRSCSPALTHADEGDQVERPPKRLRYDAAAAHRHVAAARAALAAAIRSTEQAAAEADDDEVAFAAKDRRRLARDTARLAPVVLGGGGAGGGAAGGPSAGGGAEAAADAAAAAAGAGTLPAHYRRGFEAIGGLQPVVSALREMVLLPLLYPRLMDSLGLAGAAPPRGILLHGLPGTGKTLAVRCLAGELARASPTPVSLFARGGADVLGKYHGDAERTLRLLFEEARLRAPSIIFLDELDALAPARCFTGAGGADQIHASVVSTMLALMDGLTDRGQVTVIGATNRPDQLDPALRRPGRFDREVAFGLPSRADRAAILRVHTAAWKPPPPPALVEEVAAATEGYAGADLQALCSSVVLAAVRRSLGHGPPPSFGSGRAGAAEAAPAGPSSLEASLRLAQQRAVQRAHAAQAEQRTPQLRRQPQGGEGEEQEPRQRPTEQDADMKDARRDDGNGAAHPDTNEPHAQEGGAAAATREQPSTQPNEPPPPPPLPPSPARAQAGAALAAADAEDARGPGAVDGAASRGEHGHARGGAAPPPRSFASMFRSLGVLLTGGATAGDQDAEPGRGASAMDGGPDASAVDGAAGAAQGDAGGQAVGRSTGAPAAEVADEERQEERHGAPPAQEPPPSSERPQPHGSAARPSHTGGVASAPVAPGDAAARELDWLEAVAVLERDWHAALAVAPPPSSRREAAATLYGELPPPPAAHVAALVSHVLATGVTRLAAAGVALPGRVRAAAAALAPGAGVASSASGPSPEAAVTELVRSLQAVGAVQRAGAQGHVAADAEEPMPPPPGDGAIPSRPAPATLLLVSGDGQHGQDAVASVLLRLITAGGHAAEARPDAGAVAPAALAVVSLPAIVHRVGSGGAAQQAEGVVELLDGALRAAPRRQLQVLFAPRIDAWALEQRVRAEEGAGSDVDGPGAEEYGAGSERGSDSEALSSDEGDGGDPAGPEGDALRSCSAVSPPWSVLMQRTACMATAGAHTGPPPYLLLATCELPPAALPQAMLDFFGAKAAAAPAAAETPGHAFRFARARGVAGAGSLAATAPLQMAARHVLELPPAPPQGALAAAAAEAEAELLQLVHDAVRSGLVQALTAPADAGAAPSAARRQSPDGAAGSAPTLPDQDAPPLPMLPDARLPCGVNAAEAERGRRLLLQVQHAIRGIANTMLRRPSGCHLARVSVRRSDGAGTACELRGGAHRDVLPLQRRADNTPADGSLGGAARRSRREDVVSLAAVAQRALEGHIVTLDAFRAEVAAAAARVRALRGAPPSITAPRATAASQHAHGAPTPDAGAAAHPQPAAARPQPASSAPTSGCSGVGYSRAAAAAALWEDYVTAACACASRALALDSHDNSRVLSAALKMYQLRGGAGGGPGGGAKGAASRGPSAQAAGGPVPCGRGSAGAEGRLAGEGNKDASGGALQEVGASVQGSSGTDALAAASLYGEALADAIQERLRANRALRAAVTGGLSACGAVTALDAQVCRVASRLAAAVAHVFEGARVDAASGGAGGSQCPVVAYVRNVSAAGHAAPNAPAAEGLELAAQHVVGVLQAAAAAGGDTR